MRWLIKPIIRPIARRKLDTLYQDRLRIEAAITRARKAKKRVSGLYEAAQRNTADCMKFEKWL